MVSVPRELVVVSRLCGSEIVSLYGERSHSACCRRGLWLEEEVSMRRPACFVGLAGRVPRARAGGGCLRSDPTWLDGGGCVSNVADGNAPTTTVSGS